MQALVIIPILLFAGCSTLQGPKYPDPAKVCAPNYVKAYTYTEVGGDIPRMHIQGVCGE